jgi:DNA-binding LacI/PurR family transcriptional regulator
MPDSTRPNPPQSIPPRAAARHAATANDVARHAGVSQSAVSRAFTEGASVSATTRARVLAAAAALGYRPNLIARSLITRRTGMVGVAVANLSNHLYPGMLQALADRLQAEGYRILLFTAPPDGNADPELDQIIRYQVDALVLAATTVSSALADECRAAGIPVILFNRTGRSLDVASVTGANCDGGQAIADLVARAGHRRPAFIAGDPNSSTSRDRERGFREGCAASGLPEPMVETGGYSDEGARTALTALLNRPLRPDAVFCASDQMAITAMDAARFGHHLRVPDDLSIIGFDDAPPAAWPAYALTTYSQPVQPMVEATVTLILERLADPATPPRRIVIPGELILRASCRLPSDAPA